MSKNQKKTTKNKADDKSKSTQPKKDNKLKDKQKQKPKPKPKKKFPLIPQVSNYKEIENNLELNRLFLLDYNNHPFPCNIYGEKLPSYNNDITGIGSYKMRNDTNLVDNFNRMYKLTERSYIPEISKYEGYAQGPRPLTCPLVGTLGNKKQIKEGFEKEEIKEEKNKRLQSLPPPTLDKKTVTSFMNHPIVELNHDTKKYLITLIDQYIQEKKDENKFNPEKIFNLSPIKALLKFKKTLNRNLENYYNGKDLPKPSKEILSDYKLIQKNIYSCLSRLNKTAEHQKELYKEIFRLAGTINKRMIQEKRNEKKNRVVSFGSRTIYTEAENETTYSPGKTHTTWYNTTNAFMKTENKPKDELSFLSFDNEEKQKEEAKNSKKVKKKEIELKRNCEKEEKMLIGFKQEEEKEERIFRKEKYTPKDPKIQYLKDIALLEKVNPIGVKKEKESEEKLLKLMEKKRKNRLIYERIKINK